MINVSGITTEADKNSSEELRAGSTSAGPAFSGELSEIDPNRVVYGKARRKIDPNWVETLAEEFRSPRGQMTPIEVVMADDGYLLVHGGHRNEACKRNNTLVRAFVRPAGQFANDAEIRLREIAENLMRRELTVLDHALSVATWRELYEAVKGTVKPGRKAKERISGTRATNGIDPSLGDTVLEELAGKFTENFSEAAKAALGLSRDQVFRALKVASIDDEARALIALQPISDNLRELLQLAREPRERQLQLARMIVEGTAPTIAEAIAILDQLPAPQKAPRWQKLSSTFAKLKETEQHRFFELNSAAIEKWLARKA